MSLSRAHKAILKWETAVSAEPRGWGGEIQRPSVLFSSTCGPHHVRIAARLICDPRFQALALIELIIE